MASRTLNTEFKVSGEQYYKQALAEINKGLQVHHAEMGKVTQEYKNNADSSEALTAKTDVLTRQMETQKDKANTLRQALDYVVKEYGEGSTKAMDYQAKLYRAETQVIKTSQAIEKNTEALNKQEDQLEDTTEEIVSAGDAAEDLAGKFGVNLPSGIKKALAGMNGFSVGTVAAMSAAAAAITGLIAVEKQLLEMTQQAAERAGETLTQSTVTGLSTDTIQQMEYAGKILRVEYSSITDSMRQMTNQMRSARDGSAELSSAWQSLGISITDNVTGQLRDSEQVWFDTIAALGEMENATERDALAMQLFGESAQQLNPIIQDGGERLRAYADEALNVSAVLSKDQLEALNGVQEAYVRMGEKQEAVRKHLAVEFAPAAESVYNKLGDLFEEAGDKLVKSGIVKNLGSILDSTVSILAPLGEIAADILPIIGRLLDPIAGTMAWIADSLQVVVGMSEILTGRFVSGGTRISTALGFGASSGNYSNMQKWMGYGQSTNGNYYAGNGVYTGNYYSQNATGNDNFQGGSTIVGENGPERVILPRGTQILSAQETRLTGGIYVGQISIDASNIKELNDLVRIIQQLGVDARMRGYT